MGEGIMWLFMAVLSAVFAGITSILAKCGIKKTDSDVAMALRTIVVLLFSWIIVFIKGKPRLMTTNLQGSSHRPRAVGFRLRNRKDFIYEEASVGKIY